MTSTTPVYGLPYPDNTDTLRAATKTIPQSLAQQLETTLQSFGGVANPGGWLTPTLAVGSNLAGGYALVRYRKVGNTVKLRGTINLGAAVAAGGVLMTLPVAYRPSGTSPAGTVIFVCMATAGATRVEVNSAGQVTVPNGVGGGFLALDTIEYDID